ncbi:MAG: pyruvate kinase [Deltaproteobacteria bacterium]
MQKTKIIVTLGPATEREDIILRLIGAGVNVFRLNFSHGDHHYHAMLIARVRTLAGYYQRPIAILQDISGPKIRVNLSKPLQLERDQLISLQRGNQQPPSEETITVTLPEILADLKVGQQIYFADGSIRTEVREILSNRIILRVLVGGRLTHGKGVNLPLSDLKIPVLTKKDKADLQFGLAHGVDLVALSFVRSAEDIKMTKKLIAEKRKDVPVFAKIEKAEALQHLEEIVWAADGIMIARGDLGVELGVQKVPVIQKKIIKEANGKGIPVITATQMLTSMIASPYPTRAEVSDIANAVLDGTDAVMLSDETTVGEYPEAAVKTLRETISETENSYPWYREFHEVRGVRRAIAAAAVTLSQRTSAAGIVSFTETGLSSLMVARQRPKTRVIAVTSNPQTYLRLAVVWGVEPFLAPRSYMNSDEAIYNFFTAAAEQKFLDLSAPFIVTIGRHSDKSGSTNVVQLVDEACIKELDAVFGSKTEG